MARKHSVNTAPGHNAMLQYGRERDRYVKVLGFPSQSAHDKERVDKGVMAFIPTEDDPDLEYTGRFVWNFLTDMPRLVILRAYDPQLGTDFERRKGLDLDRRRFDTIKNAVLRDLTYYLHGRKDLSRGF